MPPQKSAPGHMPTSKLSNQGVTPRSNACDGVMSRHRQARLDEDCAAYLAIHSPGCRGGFASTVGWSQRVQEFKGTRSDGQEDAIQTGTTRATARLPGLDIEIMHRRAADGDAEQISINLRAAPKINREQIAGRIMAPACGIAPATDQRSISKQFERWERCASDWLLKVHAPFWSVAFFYIRRTVDFAGFSNALH